VLYEVEPRSVGIAVAGGLKASMTEKEEPRPF
jgi:hypothetical protein